MRGQYRISISYRRRKLVLLNEFDADLDGRFITNFNPLDDLLYQRIDPCPSSLCMASGNELNRAQSDFICVNLISFPNALDRPGSHSVCSRCAYRSSSLYGETAFELNPYALASDFRSTKTKAIEDHCLAWLPPSFSCL